MQIKFTFYQLDKLEILLGATVPYYDYCNFLIAWRVRECENDRY